MTAKIDGLSETFAGQMSSAEVEFCKQTRELLRAVLDGRERFEDAMRVLLVDLKMLGRYAFDIDAAAADGLTPVVGKTVARLQNVPPGAQPLTDAQKTFLHDVIGYLDFAARNGLNFMFVWMGVAHDVSGLSGYHWDFEEAAADFFSPKTSGWSERNRATFGDPDEEPG